MFVFLVALAFAGEHPIGGDERIPTCSRSLAPESFNPLKLGIVFGSLALIFVGVITFLIWSCCCRKRKKKKRLTLGEHSMMTELSVGGTA
jgi:hypothetical protein